MSGSAKLSDQAAWTSLGAAALIVAGTGNAIWLLSGRRAIGERHRSIFARLTPAAEGVLTTAADSVRVAAENMTRYHRPDCQLVIGKQVREAKTATHERAGRTACGVCNP